jgi:hypothetical protein
MQNPNADTRQTTHTHSTFMSPAHSPRFYARYKTTVPVDPSLAEMEIPKATRKLMTQPFMPIYVHYPGQTPNPLRYCVPPFRSPAIPSIEIIFP